MDGKDLTRLFLLNNYSDDLDTTDYGMKNNNLVKKQKSDINIIKSNINKSRRYIKKLKESPTIKNYRKSMYQLKQSGGYEEEEDQEGSGWRDDFYNRVKGTYSNASDSFKKHYKNAKQGIKEYESYGQDLYKNAKEGIKSDIEGYNSYGKKLYRDAKQGIKDDVKKNVDILKNYYSDMNKEDEYHKLKRKQAREGSRDHWESTEELDKLDEENPKWAAFYKKARESGYGKYLGGTDSECSRDSCDSHKGAGLLDFAKKAQELVGKVDVKKLTGDAEEMKKKIAESAKKLEENKNILKGLFGGKTKELYNYAKTNNKMKIFPQAVGKMILTYGKKHGQKSVMKFGGKLKSLIENEIGGNIDQFGDKLGGEIKEIINKHVDDYNNKLVKIANMYADKYPSKYNNLMRNIDFKTDLNNVMKGGNSKALQYSPNLSADDMISLKIDHSDIKKNINLLDHKIKKLLKGGKKEILSGGSKKIKKIKNKFRELLIQRRILIDELVDLELKFNSIEKKDVLEDSNQLYQIDREFRNMADNLGMGFDLDENTKKAFMNNRQLKLANDTLGDLNKALNRILKKQFGGKNIFSYELFISESKVQTGGGSSSSKAEVQKQIDRVCENYLKLIEVFKMNENAILGLNVESNAELLEKIQIFVNKINEIIRNIHIFNSRFTNKVSQEEINVIAYQMSVYEKEFDSNEKELNELVKFNVNSQSGGALPYELIKDVYLSIIYKCCLLIKNNNNNNLEYKKCLLKIIQYFLTNAPGEWTDKISKDVLADITKVVLNLLRLRGPGSSIILKEIPEGFSYGDTKNYKYNEILPNRTITNFLVNEYKFPSKNAVITQQIKYGEVDEKQPYYNRTTIDSNITTLMMSKVIDTLNDSQLNEVLNIDYISNYKYINIDGSPVNLNMTLSKSNLDRVMGTYDVRALKVCINSLVKPSESSIICNKLIIEVLSDNKVYVQWIPQKEIIEYFIYINNVNDSENNIDSTIVFNSIGEWTSKILPPGNYELTIGYNKNESDESISCGDTYNFTIPNIIPPPPPSPSSNKCPGYNIFQYENKKISFTWSKQLEIKKRLIRIMKKDDPTFLSPINSSIDESVEEYSTLPLNNGKYLYEISVIYNNSPDIIFCNGGQFIISDYPPNKFKKAKFTIKEELDSVEITWTKDDNIENESITVTCTDENTGYDIRPNPGDRKNFDQIITFNNLSPNTRYKFDMGIDYDVYHTAYIVINSKPEPKFRVEETENTITFFQEFPNPPDPNIIITCDQLPRGTVLNFDQNINLAPMTLPYIFILKLNDVPCLTVHKTVPFPPGPNAIPLSCPTFNITEGPRSVNISILNETSVIQNLIITCNQKIGNKNAGDTLNENTSKNYIVDELEYNKTYTFFMNVTYTETPGVGSTRCGQFTKTIGPPPLEPENQCPVFTINETSNSIIITKTPTPGVNVKITTNETPSNIFQFTDNIFQTDELQPGTIIYTLTAEYPNKEEKLCGTITKTVSKIEPTVLRPKQCPKFNVSGDPYNIIIEKDNDGRDDIDEFYIQCDDNTVDSIPPNSKLYEGLDKYESGVLDENKIYTFSIYVKYTDDLDGPDDGYLCTRIIKNVPKIPEPLPLVPREGQCPLFDISEENKKIKITHRQDTGKYIERIFVNEDKDTNRIPLNDSWTSDNLPIGEHIFIIYTKYDGKEKPEECHKFTLKISDTVDTSNQCPTFTISETENSVKFKHNNDTGKNIKEIIINGAILPLNGEIELKDLIDGENEFNIEVKYIDGDKSICHTYTKNVVKKKKETAEIGTSTEEEKEKEKENGVTIHNNNNPTIMPIINVHVPGGIGGPGGNSGPIQPEKKLILTIKSNPDSISKIKEGTPISITASSNFDIEEDNYAWFINNEEIPNERSSTITISKFPTNTGIVQCKFGEIVSNILIINIKSLKDNSKLDKIIEEEEEINRLLALLLKEAKKKKSIISPFKTKRTYSHKAPSAFDRPDILTVSANPIVTSSPVVTANPTSISNPVVTANPTSVANPVSSSNSSSASSSSSGTNTKGGYLRFKNLRNLRNFKGGATLEGETNYIIGTLVIHQRKIGEIIDINNEDSSNILYKIVFENGNELILNKSNFILLNQENIEQKLKELRRLLKKESNQSNINFKTVNEPNILNTVVNYLEKFDNFDDYKGPTQSEKKLTEDIITENNPGFNELDKVNYAHINKIFNTTGLNIDQNNENYELIQVILRHTKQSLPIYKRVEGIEEKEPSQTGGAENIDNLKLWDKINSMNGGSKYSWTPIQSRRPDSPFTSGPSTPDESDDEFSSNPNPLFIRNIPSQSDELPEPDEEVTEDTSRPPPPRSRSPFTKGPSTPETSDDEGEFTVLNHGYKNKLPNLKKNLESDDKLPEPDEGLTEDTSRPPPPRSRSPFTKGPSTPETSDDEGEFSSVNPGYKNKFLSQSKKLSEPSIFTPPREDDKEFVGINPLQELQQQVEKSPELSIFTPPNEEDDGEFAGINPLQEIKIRGNLEQQLEDKNKELASLKNEINSVPYINILERTKLLNRKRELDREISIIESKLLKLTPSKKEESDEDIANKRENDEKRKRSLNNYGTNPLRKKVSPIRKKSTEPTLKLTNEELDSLNVTSNNGDVINEINLSSIIKKIDDYSLTIEKNNEIDVKQFNTVYFTSDIHSDYVKFVNILKSANIIKFEPDIGIIDSNMYNPNIITNARWVPNNTLFIILGDLIDGKRGPSNFVNDVKGSSEFLLHALIYNLRIDALTKNSNILFTLGNHDHHSIILSEPQIVRDYATSTALKFFKSPETRSDALLPFYKCSPYYYVFLKNGDKIEVSGVHGEFIDIKDDSTPINKENFEKLQTLQNKLNQKITNFRQSIIETDTNDLLGNINNSILWSRNYAKLNNEVDNTSNNCDKLSYPLTVVGHCPTSISNHGSHSFTYISQLLEKRNKDLPSGEKKCDTHLEGHRGCVALGCENESDKRPKLAFVDIAMSHAFFEQEEVNKDRIIEILKLDHTIDDPKYYYDKISLKIIDKNSSKEEKVWSVSDQQEVERLKKETELAVQVETVTSIAQNAQAEAQEAKEEAQNAQENAQEAKEDAQEAQEDAQEAKEDAQEAKEDAQEAQEDAQEAKEDAQEAKEDAQEAQEDAKDAQEDAQKAQKEVDAVEKDVISVKENVDDSEKTKQDVSKSDTADTIHKEIINFLLNDITHNDDNILNPDINNIDNDELEQLLLTIDISDNLKIKISDLISELADNYNASTDDKYKIEIGDTISSLADKYNS